MTLWRPGVYWAPHNNSSHIQLDGGCSLQLLIKWVAWLAQSQSKHFAGHRSASAVAVALGCSDKHLRPSQPALRRGGFNDLVGQR